MSSPRFHGRFGVLVNAMSAPRSLSSRMIDVIVVRFSLRDVGTPSNVWLGPDVV